MSAPTPIELGVNENSEDIEYCTCDTTFVRLWRGLLCFVLGVFLTVFFLNSHAFSPWIYVAVLKPVDGHDPEIEKIQTFTEDGCKSNVNNSIGISAIDSAFCVNLLTKEVKYRLLPKAIDYSTVKTVCVDSKGQEVTTLFADKHMSMTGEYGTKKETVTCVSSNQKMGDPITFTGGKFKVPLKFDRSKCPPKIAFEVGENTTVTVNGVEVDPRCFSKK